MENSYITIQGWMRTQLGLSGNELMIYAIIYGFSQDGESKFTGSRQYLADWCGCTVRSVQTCLNNLVEQGLLTKTEKFTNNVKICEYAVNFTSSEKISPPSEKISLNNIAYTIEDNKELSKDNYDDGFEGHSYSVDDFLGSAKKKSRKRGKSLYDKCVDAINEFTDIPSIQLKLTEYLKFRISIKDKPIYNVNQWKSLLNKLDKSVEECRKEYVDIIQQSLDKGWLSFYPIKEYTKEVFSEYGEVDCTKGDDSVDEEF